MPKRVLQTSILALGRFLVRYLPPLRRLYLWRRMLCSMRGTTTFGSLLLVLSAVADTVMVSLTRSWSMSPRCLFSLQVRLLPWNLKFWVRGKTDDIYNIVPYCEDDVHSAVLDHLNQGDVFIDVGANIGYYTILGARRVSFRGKVVAIEMVPQTAELLRKNVLLNGCGNVEVIEAAVFSRAGLQLNVRMQAGLFGQASVDRARPGNICARTVTLDEVCRPYEKVRLVKVDIEGAEMEALKGGIETLAKTDYLVVECNSGVEQVASFLRERGFRVQKLRFTTYILASREDVASSVCRDDPSSTLRRLV